MKILILESRFLLLLLFFTLFSSSYVQSKDPIKSILGDENFGTGRNDIFNGVAEAPGPASNGWNTLVLAANRTKRPDILRHLKPYRAGWDIANKHYWASVGFTGSFGFILAALWFVSFGLALVLHHCCEWRIKFKGKGSSFLRRISLLLLIIFTCSAAIGSLLLSIGQNKFHGEAMHTLDYVVNQSSYTVETLRNVTEYLSLAKTINIAQVFLPSDVKDNIDKLNVDLKTAADTLGQKTSENSTKIQRVFSLVRLSLILIAALMLVLSLLGLFLSLLGHKHAIHLFIVSGWFLVAITFTLWGVFVILNNTISDTCMAMGEWVDNPHAATALSDILPCVDQRTTNQTLVQSKQVVTDIVNIVNQFVYTVANSNLSSNNPSFYNQSGPPMPPLCYPFDDRLQDRQCTMQEVSMQNASLVWGELICRVSESGLCISSGRIKPEMYIQLVDAVNISLALQLYAPPLLSFQDCNFVRATFWNITVAHCPPLRHHLRLVNAGLALISVGVMLCLVVWLLYANRPQREEVFAKLSSIIRSSYKKGCLKKDVSSGRVPSV
ncbi:uncharacterized protein LOC124925469 [Impatiens glandulifera]|uniref:uncharacterized protein LOC124925469 n=1 Tax=Impatiens glandulifera TaxID=253017 RepID=UPI001FB0934B|nr:uncharacterized protein LOC124925469 [Impatiens glandulifera]